MSKTTSERIESLKTEMEQKQNLLKQLIQKEKGEEKKARTHRLCKRAGLLESLLPNTATLTDEQFETFLKKTTANDFGKKILSEICGQVSVVSAQRAEIAQEEDS